MSIVRISQSEAGICYLDIAGLEAITGAAAEAGAGLVNGGQAVQLRLAWVRRLGLGVTGC